MTLNEWLEFGAQLWVSGFIKLPLAVAAVCLLIGLLSDLKGTRDKG